MKADMLQGKELYPEKIREQTIVCLPVLDEAGSIREMIHQIRSEGFELVVTDGGSTDGSQVIAGESGVPVLHRPGKGKGFGLRQALEHAHRNNKKNIVFIDCDLTYPVDRIKDLLSLLGKNDMVIGCRSYENMSLKSKILNTVLRYILRLLFPYNLKDAASGFRALRVEAFLGEIRVEGIDVELDFLGIATRKSLKIGEVDVEYYHRVGESKLRLTDILKVALTILKVRFNY